MIILLCLDLPRRHDAFAVDARLPACLLRDQRDIWWRKLLFAQTLCWNVNISVIFYRTFSGIRGTVQRMFKKIHDEQRRFFFFPQKKLPCFQTECLLILRSNVESAWTSHHCACFLFLVGFFLSKVYNRTWKGSCLNMYWIAELWIEMIMVLCKVVQWDIIKCKTTL